MKNLVSSLRGGMMMRVLCAFLALVMLGGMLCVGANYAYAEGTDEYADSAYLDGEDAALTDPPAEEEEPVVTPTPEILYRKVEATDTQNGFYVSVEGFMRSDVALVLKPLSELALDYLRGGRELTEDEFFLAYELCLVTPDNTEIEVNPGDGEYKITIYFTEKDKCFADDLAIAAVGGTLGDLETTAAAPADDAATDVTDTDTDTDTTPEDDTAAPTDDNTTIADAGPATDTPADNTTAPDAEAAAPADDAATDALATDTDTTPADDTTAPTDDNTTTADVEPAADTPADNTTAPDADAAAPADDATADALDTDTDTTPTDDTAAPVDDANDEADDSEEAQPVAEPNKPSDVSVSPAYNGKSFAVCTANGLGIFKFSGTSYIAGEDEEAETLTATSGNFTFAAQGALPDGVSKLSVLPIEDATQDELIEYLAEMGITLEGEGTVYAFDISLLDEQGNSLQPTDGAVNLRVTGISTDNEISVFHEHGDAPATLTADDAAAADTVAVAAPIEQLDCIAENGVIEFSTTGFSTYYIVSGYAQSSYKSGDSSIFNAISDIVEMDEVHKSTIYVAPGTKIRFITMEWSSATSIARANWKFDDYANGHITAVRPKWTAYGGGVDSDVHYYYNEWSGQTYSAMLVGSGNKNNMADHVCEVNVSTDAQPGEYIKLYRSVRTAGSNVKWVNIVVMDEKDVVSNTLNNGTYPVYLTVLSDSTSIPSEPTVSTHSYYYADSSYTTYSNKAPTFADTAVNVVSNSVLDSSHLANSADGTCTVGIVRSSNADPKDFVINVDWNRLLQSFAKLNPKASNGVTVTTSNYQNYEIIPYVVKLHTAKSLGWHIDCCIVPKNTINLFYNANLYDGYSIDGLSLPDGVNSVSPIASTVGYAKKNGSNITVNQTVKCKDDSDTGSKDDKYAKFTGWNTEPDGTGTSYAPGTNISITQDTTLYAQWVYTPVPYGTVTVKKVVAGDTEGKLNGLSYNMKLTGISMSGTLYNSKGVKIGTVNSSSFNLQDGQYATFEKITAGTNVSVNETTTGQFTATYKNNNTTVKGGVDNTITVTNTYKASTTSYKVEHYQQNLNDNNYTLKDTENVTNAKVGAQTEAKAKSYDGFTLKEAVKQQTVKADGTTVVKLYYNRNTYDVTVNFYEYDGKKTETKIAEPETLTAQKFGAEITADSRKKDIDGFTYKEADKTKLTVGTDTKNNVINLYYERNTYSVVVNHYELVDGKPSTTKVADPDTLTAQKFGAEITSADKAKTIDGFTYKQADPTKLTVGKDESKNVINLYYQRNTYSVTVYHYELVGGERTTTEVADPDTLKDQKFGVEITSADKKADIANFTYKEAAPETLTVSADTSKNVIKLYYERDTATVTVTEKVSGTMGDRGKSFTMLVGYKLNVDDEVTWVSPNDGADTKYTDGTSKTYTIPKGAYIVISETDADGYSMTAQFGADVGATAATDYNVTSTGTLSANTLSIIVENAKDGTPDTGVSLDSLPYIIALAVAVCGVAIVIVRSRKRKG